MKYIKLYIVSSMILGITQIIDGVILILNKGYLDLFNLVILGIENIWILLTIAALIMFVKNKISVISPVSYMFYYAVAMAYAFTVPMTDNSLSPEIYSIPIWLCAFEIVFGVIFSIINYKHLRYHHG